MEFATIIRSDDWLMDALALCRDHLPVNAYIGAGAIRHSIWDHLHGFPHRQAGDVDVVYFDAATPPGTDAELSRLLCEAQAGSHWDVTNQAHVHLWYPEYFGKPVAPLESLEHALATWPDTATAVAVRLDADDRLDVLAPFGLDDLLGLVLRWNPSRISHDDFTARIHSKQWLSRWPRLRVQD